MFSRILDDIRNKIGAERRRVDLLTRKDVENIKRSFNIYSKEGVRQTNDAINVEIWVEECKSQENNPVLLYKPPGVSMDGFENSDFCLVIMDDQQESLLKQFGENILAIDSTHDLNNYDFELTTLMVVDEFNEGVPAAFMFTNKIDPFFIKIFFNLIKQKMGQIKSNTFVGDTTGAFYNGWVEVMSPSNHQLYCSWHIDRAWRKNLNKISNKDKRIAVYKTLKHLQRNTEFDDADEFCLQLQIAVNGMLDDVETKVFGEHFLNNYLNNYRKWAHYFRPEKMKIESMHKVVKYFYLNGKCVKTLDKGLHAILQYLRDKTTDRLVKQTKGKRTCKSQEHSKSHRLAVSANFYMSLERPGVWIVGQNNDDYVVSKTSLTEKCCNRICQFCDICVHQFTCTCPHFSINGVICVHIHFVQSGPSDCNNDDFDNIMSNVEVSAAVESLSFCNESNSQNANECERKDELLTEISNLQMLVHSADFSRLSEGAFQQIVSNIQTSKNLLQQASTSTGQDITRTCQKEKKLSTAKRRIANDAKKNQFISIFR